jgi:hypothetical protein
MYFEHFKDRSFKSRLKIDNYAFIIDETDQAD